MADIDVNLGDFDLTAAAAARYQCSEEAIH
jgi:hypothetical protein